MRTVWLILILLASLLTSGCELIGDIFQAGVAVGVILVLLVLVGIAYLGRKLMR